MVGIGEDCLAATIDQDNGIFIIAGEGKLYTWNLSTFAFTDRSSSSSGNKTAQNSRFAGLTWDSRNHKVVGFAAGGRSIYTLDTSTWVWTQVTASGGPTPPVTYYPYSDMGGGVYGRFQYSASRDVFVYAVNMDNNVYVLKNPEDNQDNQTPAAPKGLKIIN
jgi:hypothetical protein